jgi:hypothetical protein
MARDAVCVRLLVANSCSTSSCVRAFLECLQQLHSHSSRGAWVLYWAWVAALLQHFGGGFCQKTCVQRSDERNSEVALAPKSDQPLALRRVVHLELLGTLWCVRISVPVGSGMLHDYARQLDPLPHFISGLKPFSDAWMPVWCVDQIAATSSRVRWHVQIRVPAITQLPLVRLLRCLGGFTQIDHLQSRQRWTLSKRDRLANLHRAG